MKKNAAILTLIAALPFSALADEGRFSLAVVETGMRDYYCALTVRLTNHTGAQIDDINGYFELFSAGEMIAAGRSASFQGIAPGDTGDATFLAPNEPCNEIDGYAFRVGACRLDGSFENRGDCAAGFTAAPPIISVAAR